MNRNSTDKEKIGLFGGTFNPIHLGHIKAASVVRRIFMLDKIFFIPSYIPPHKESSKIASPFHRLRMVELAVEGCVHFIASPIEIEEKGTSYSILTLQKIKKVYPEAVFFFILGIDAFLDIETWKDHDSVLEQCRFVVISRKGFRLEDAKNVMGGRHISEMVKLPSDETIKEESILSHKIFLLPFDALDIASTEIRERLKEARSVNHLVPEPVAEYILTNHLYQ